MENLAVNLEVDAFFFAEGCLALILFSICEGYRCDLVLLLVVNHLLCAVVLYDLFDLQQLHLSTWLVLLCNLVCGRQIYVLPTGHKWVLSLGSLSCRYLVLVINNLLAQGRTVVHLLSEQVLKVHGSFCNLIDLKVLVGCRLKHKLTFLGLL